MKKCIAFLTITVYIAVTCGVVINFHFCMDKLASTQLFAAESKICGKCGMHTDSSDGCCRDEIKIIKMDDDQKSNSFESFELAPLAALTHTSSDFLFASLLNGMKMHLFNNHSPPLLSEQDTYLHNRVFRI